MPNRGRWLLPLALGLSDGILNALVLATSTLLHRGHSVSIGLAVRIALAALVTAVFTVFVAEYAHLRAELVRAEHELNLTKSGRLAASALGRAVAREALEAAILASGASFVGGFAPLAVGAAVPADPWCSLLAAVTTLGLLGTVLARATGGRARYWASALVLSGVLVVLVGSQLKIA